MPLMPSFIRAVVVPTERVASSVAYPLMDKLRLVGYNMTTITGYMHRKDTDEWVVTMFGCPPRAAHQVLLQLFAKTLREHGQEKAERTILSPEEIEQFMEVLKQK